MSALGQKRTYAAHKPAVVACHSWPCFDTSWRAARRLSWASRSTSPEKRHGKVDRRFLPRHPHHRSAFDQIAVEIVGGGLPLIFLVAVLMMLSEFAARLRENTTSVPHQPDPCKRRVGRRSSSTGRNRPFRKLVPDISMSALPPKADMCSALGDVRFGPKADITELGFHQRLDFTSLIVVFVAPLPFHCSPLSSSPAKQLG